MHACFVSVPVIQKYFRDEYQLELETKQIGRYDPLRSYYEGGERWREVHKIARENYRNNVHEIPVANQSYRLNILQKGIEAAEKSKNWVLAAQLTEQAAKEVGGVMTNQRNFKVDDDRKKSVRDMTPEDRKIAMADVIHRAKEHFAALAAEKSDTVQ